MTVVVRITCALTDWTDPTEVEVEYGEVTVDLSTVGALMEAAEIDPSECTMRVYTLSSDASMAHDNVTHVVALQMGVDSKVGGMFWLDEIITGPFMFLLARGDKLEGFHCDKCAHNFVEWLMDKQSEWKERFRAQGKKEIKKHQVH